uniref:Uncharacterized protein n=1 Tax=viral metagenome TaxID=1070528 RepID=A0A6C0AF25_9ZZZZ
MKYILLEKLKIYKKIYSCRETKKIIMKYILLEKL